jgi:DME family drug/metabolite transporter
LGDLLGYALIGVAVASWTLAPSLMSRLAARDGSFNPIAFNGWRMAIAAALLAPVAVAYGFPYTAPWLDPTFHLGLLVGGVVGTVAGDTAFVYAVARVGACVAVPIAYLFVVWSSLVDLALGEASPTIIPAAAASVAGVWLVQRGPYGGDRRGLLAALLASLVWTAGNYGYKAAVEAAVGWSNSMVAASVTVAFARALYALAALAPSLTRWSPCRGLVETVGASVTGYVVGALAYIAALDLLPVSVVSVGLSANPVLVQFTASLVAGEKLELRLVAGSALVALGIALTALA